LGGNLGECGNDLMIGQDSSIFITGWTSSPDFYTSQFAFDRTLNGTRDGFLINLASDGSEIQFSTLIGGISSDECSYSVIDAEGSCYITGWTRSRDFPMIGGLQPERGGESDCFILKLNDNGSDVLYSSFLGGFDDDSPRGLAIDTWGCVYIVGGTNSDDFPMANAFDEELDGELNVEFSIDCFISKLDLSTNRLLYSSYLGGNSNDDPEGIALDASSNIILCGMTNAEDFPVTANSHQSEFMGGAMDAFLSILYDWGNMDNDLLAECQENILETDRANNDTDSDLLPDGYEVANELDPNNPNDALLDHDNDGLTTYFEFTIGTDPRNQDSDFDTYPDGWEVANGYPPDDDNVSLREVIHYNIPLIILVSFTVIGLYAAYRFRDTFTHKKEEPILDDKEETLKAFEELTGDLPPTELVAKELLKPDVASLEVNVEHFRLLEQDVTRLEEIEEVLESSVKLSLVNSGAEPADIQEITVDFLTKDRSSLDSVELEVLIELERLIDLPPPKEILRLLEARRRLELELDELGGLKEE
ncbi:MAG: SBBP repeat-containing protein, partial [Candidatus Thorarchaeota archaeon]